MKKAFDQTVRDLKREVNKKVLKVPSIEQKVLDATSNEPWGPHGSHLADIAQATWSYHEYQMIMAVIWKRINDTGKNWRHVYKALTILEYLVAHGSEHVIDEIREHAYQISTLSDFQYTDSSGRDQGSNVRRKSQSLVALINNKERIQEVREKAAANKEKHHGSRTNRPDSYGHGDRFDDDRFEGRRYGNRDEDRNGYGRERDSGYDRYGRGGDSYSRGGDRYVRDSDERYGREAYGDDNFRGRGSDSYQFRSRSRSVDVDPNRSFDDDDRYSYRSGGARAVDHIQDERRPECKLSEQNANAPPSYEEATRDAQNYVQDERDGGTILAPTDDTSSPAAPKATSPSKGASEGPDPAATDGSEAAPDNKVDDFDPRGSVAGAAPLGESSQELDIFGSLSAPDSANSMPQAAEPSGIMSSEPDMQMSSAFGTNFVAPSTASAAVNQPVEDPFGDSPFKAIPQEDFLAQPQSFTSAPSFQPPGSTGGTETEPPIAPTMEAFSNFDFGDALGGITYAPSVANSQHSSAGPTFLAPELPMALPSNDILADILPQTSLAAQNPTQAVQYAALTSKTSDQMNFLPQSEGAILPQTTLAAQIPSQTAQSAAPATAYGAQMNFIPHSGQSTPQEAPVSSQAAYFAAPTSGQTAHPKAPTATCGAQIGLLPYSELSTPQAASATSQAAYFAAPASMQTAQPAGLTTIHSTQMSFLPHSELSTPQAAPVTSQAAHFAAPASMQTGQPAASANNLPLQSIVSAPLVSQAASTTSAVPPQPSKFQPKSSIWADTLSRGLIDLNISGPKVNPLADIGIDFDAMNRMEKRKEAKSSATPVTSTIAMGKAMGAGSGMGRTGAGGLAPPPNPMINHRLGMGMGIGMMGGGTGMGMGVGMSMGGYGGGMNQLPMGMGMNMGMGQGAPMQPPTGMPPGPDMPGVGYNPMMGMGNNGSQQPYGGGYR